MIIHREEIIIRNSAAEYLTFVAAVGENPNRVELRYEDKNVWLSQRMMAELYGVEVRTINEHIQKDIFEQRVVGGGNYPEFPNSSNRW